MKTAEDSLQCGTQTSDIEYLQGYKASVLIKRQVYKISPEKILRLFEKEG
jgi:hypothetical protein